MDKIQRDLCAQNFALEFTDFTKSSPFPRYFRHKTIPTDYVN